jgi:curved DNA-binding protein CbpA
MTDSKINYYNILKVNKQSSLEDIKKSYKKLAVKYHPDKGGDPEIFKNISEAYQVLSDPEKRRVYDNGNTFDNLHYQNQFKDADELFNFIFNVNNIKNSRNYTLFSQMANLNLGTNNINSFSKSTSVVISNGKKIETITEIKNGVKSETKTETDLKTGKILKTSSNQYLQ